MNEKYKKNRRGKGGASKDSSSGSRHGAGSFVFEADELFRGFFLTSPDSVVLSRLDTGIIVDMSESFTRDIGYSREEALGRTSNDLNLWPDLADRQRFVDKLKEEGFIHNWETVFRAKDGKILQIILSANIITYKDEPYILTMTRIVDELIYTQQALQESEEKYRLLADNATDIIWTMDMNMNYTYFSPSVQRVRGFTAQEAVEQSLEEVLTPQSLLLARETMANYLREEKSGNLEPGQVVTLELEMYHKDGSTVWGEIASTFTRDADGNPTGIQGVTRDISERKKAEKALSESEAKFRNIIESSPMGIFLYRLENSDRLIFTESNHAASTILGIDTSSLIGMTIEEAFPALAETEIPEKFLEVAMKGKPWSWNQVDYDHGGVRGAYEVNAFQSSPGVVAVYFLDVTEKKKGERALQESEERFRTVFRKSPDALAIMNAKNRTFVDVSDGFTRVTGYSRKEVVGKAPTEFNSWVDVEAEQAYLEMLRFKSSVEPMEAQFRKKDGSVFTGIISANMVSISGESHIIANIDDITQLKSAESALRESEERYRLLIANIPDVTWISDEKGVTTFISPNIEGIYGYTPDEIYEAGDRLWFERIHPEDVAKVKDSFEELFSKANSFDIEYRVQRKDGEWIWLHDRAMASFEREGARYAYGVFSDITRQKEVEEERKKVQAKLIQANKMTSLGLMVSSVAHEINNPNNFIMFNSQLIADFLKDGIPLLESYACENEGVVLGGLAGEDFGEVLPKLLSGITDGTKMITSIVDELKDFVRQSHQAINVEIEVNDIVKRAHAIIDNHIRKFTDNLIIELGDDLPRIYGKKQQLIQVIVNLILNALEALPDKKHGIRISTGLSDNRDKVEIHVVDEGSGIPDELLGEVSEPFFTTKQEMGGTGLGLAICYSIISDHGGTMTIESVEGRGTTVSIFLPVS
jgi:PAS domain S-box-containing protein